MLVQRFTGALERAIALQESSEHDRSQGFNFLRLSVFSCINTRIILQGFVQGWIERDGKLDRRLIRQFSYA